MLDLQNLRELGKGGGREGVVFFSPSLPPLFFYSLIPPSPPKKPACIKQADYHWVSRDGQMAGTQSATLSHQ